MGGRQCVLKQPSNHSGRESNNPFFLNSLVFSSCPMYNKITPVILKTDPTKPQVVLHITRIAKGGVIVVLDQLVRGLDKNRYKPVVIFDTPQSSDIRKNLVSSAIETVELVEVRDVLGEQMASGIRKHKRRRPVVEKYLGKLVHQIYLSTKSGWAFLSRDLPRVKRIRNIIKESGAVLVHTHSDLRCAKPEIVAAKLTGVPCITHRHSYSKYNWFDKLFAFLVEANIYISSDVASHHVMQGEPEKKGVVIHNGINPADYGQQCDIEDVRNEFTCGQNQQLVGLVARLDWWKGHEFFIEAMAEVVQQHDNVKGLIIGGIAELHYDRSQHYLDNLHEMVQSLGLEESIIFAGHRSDIPRLVSALDVVVHASSTPEPFGLTIIEGMAAGKPVVATAAGGVLDIIENGKSGLLVPCQDSRAMATAIINLIVDRDKAEQIGHAARQRVVEKFTVEKQVAAVQLLYDSLLKGN